MPKAEANHSTIIREMLARPLPEDAPHPDAALIGLCADIMDLDAEEDQIRKAYVAAHCREEVRDAYMAARKVIKNRRCSATARAGKLTATTAAGIYSKALVVKKSNGFAARLALTLADELLSNAELRLALWPVGEVS